MTPITYIRPLSCSIVFGVAGWATTMEVMTESNVLEKRILTKHYFFMNVQTIQVNAMRTINILHVSLFSIRLSMFGLESFSRFKPAILQVNSEHTENHAVGRCYI